ncbi:MAG: sigma factor, partial [Pseudomonadota bacterium]
MDDVPRPATLVADTHTVLDYGTPVSPPEEAQSPISVLYQEYAAELAEGLRKRFGNGPPDPDDVAQEAFQKVLERGDLSTIKNLRAFLWRTARNLILSSKRSDHRRSAYDFEIEQLFF